MQKRVNRQRRSFKNNKGQLRFAVGLAIIMGTGPSYLRELTFCPRRRSAVSSIPKNALVCFHQPSTIGTSSNVVRCASGSGSRDLGLLRQDPGTETISASKQCWRQPKTTSSRHLKEPNGPLALDAQLVCYSQITGISDENSCCFRA